MEAIFKLTIDSGTFEADIVKAKRAIEELKKEKVLYDEKRKLGLQLSDEEIAIEQKLVASIKAHQTQLNSLNKITQLNTEANIAQKGSIDQITKQYKAAELQLKAMGGTVERGTDGILKLTGVNKENEQATYELFQTMKQFDAQLGKNNLNVGNYGSVLQKLKQQILDLDQQRSIANDPNEVMRLTTEIRKLTLQQDQYLGKVDELGNRVAKNDIKDGFMDASGALGALSSGMFLLTMGMDDNSKSGEIMRKVMIGLTVAQTALSIAQSKADVLGTINIVKTKAQAAAQWLYTTAIGASTGALRIFKIALATTGIGAVVIGIAVLIERMRSLKPPTKDAAETQEDLNNKLKETTDLYNSLANAMAKQDVNLKNRIELRKAQGASEKELLDLNKQLLQKEIESIDQALQTHTSLEVAGDLLNRKAQAQQEISVLEAEYYKNVNDKYLETERKRREEDNKRLDQLALLTVAEKKRLDEQIKNQFLDNPNVQDAFQKLLGVDDATFQAVWERVGETTSEQEIILQGVEQAQNNLTAAAQRTNKEYELAGEYLDTQEQKIYALGAVMSEVFQGAFADADDAQKKFFKSAIVGLLNYLQKFVMEKKIEALVTQLSGKGFLGLVTGAAIVGLIDGAFAAAKSQITGYAEGGLVLPEHGVPIQRDNGDNRLATIKTGEVIMNETQQQRLKAAAGSDIFKKLGIPGFATGGVMDGGFAFRQATARTNDNLEIRQAVMDAVRSMPPNTLYISDLERMQRDRGRALNIVSLDK